MLDELGKGGFATVYKVRHDELGYVRAIRVLNETIVDSASETYQKFLRECKLLLRLGNGNHPNIVHIYQPRLLDNKALVEMDYVDGLDIRHYLEQNKHVVPAEDVIRMALQISSALAYCHEDVYRFCMDKDEDSLQDDPNDGSKVLVDDKTRERLIEKYKVIHNDIHSGNIMRREDGSFVLLDFGLAINGDEVVRSSRRTNGAPEFKAPEKWDDDTKLTEQSDIYSFGIVLFQYLAGRVPFPYEKAGSKSYEAEYKLAQAHQNATPPSIEAIRKEFFERKFAGQEYKRDYPQWLEDTILKCLRKNPAERFKNGKELFDFISLHAQTADALCYDVKLERLTEEKKGLAAQINDLNGKNHDLSTQLEVKIDECGILEKDLRKANDTIEELKNKKGKTKPIVYVLLMIFAIWAVFMTFSRIIQSNNSGDENKEIVQDVRNTSGKTVSPSESTKIKNLEDQVRKLKKELDNKKNEIDNLKATIAKREAAIVERQKTIANLQEEVNNLTNSNKTLERMVKDKSLVNTSPSPNVESLKQQLTQKTNEVTKLQKEINSLKTDLKKKEQDLAEKNKEIEVLKKTFL